MFTSAQQFWTLMFVLACLFGGAYLAGKAVEERDANTEIDRAEREGEERE